MTVAKLLRRLQDLVANLVAALETMLLFPALFRDPFRTRPGPFHPAYWRRRSLDSLADEVDRLFTAPLTSANMCAMSDQIRAQLSAALQSSQINMLPSYTRTLPTGAETGTFLALDVGGSTLRVALVHLAGQGSMTIRHVASTPIDEEVKLLEGTRFFDWMASHIDTMLAEVDAEDGRGPVPLSVGLSWSFPLEQTSHNTGLLIHMGKGFMCSTGTVGQELGQLITEACRRRNLSVAVDAIVNDGSATLLSRAYVDPTTRMSLILGTGTNMAIHYPVDRIGRAKFGDRRPAWFEGAPHVIVNTEMSMFGGAVLPLTRWDEILNQTHLRPDYQPLEYMITGRYLGEIVRLVIVEAVETAHLFRGELPHSMRDAYSFDTSLLAAIELDPSPQLTISAALLHKEHPAAHAPRPEDMRFLRRVCQTVSRRAAGYLATAIHSMWSLHNDAEIESPADPVPVPAKAPKQVTVIEREGDPRSLSIACDGSVINKYPGFRDHCQAYLDQLTHKTAASHESLDPLPSLIHLDPAPESAILGAAVAVAIAVSEQP